MEKDLIFKKEVYQIVGMAMEIHRILGRGLKEVVYKDALEYEFQQRSIDYEREKKYKVHYKDTILSHDFQADFVVFENLILEVKARESLIDEDIKQALNYISICKSPLCLLILQHRRVIHSDYAQ